MSRLELVALVVRDYEPAIDFFVNVLGFELVEDKPSLTKVAALGLQPRIPPGRPSGTKTHAEARR